MKLVIMLTALAGAVFMTAAETNGPGTFIGHERVDGLFAKGGEIAKGTDYKVSANRRTGAGQVEVHDKETDIFHVMEGEATLVVGGKMIGGKQSRPDQWLGTEIEGGTTYQLAKGDVVTIPAGTPHWFKQVPKLVIYYTVKVVKP